MLEIKQVKELMSDENLSDQEAEEIRDACQTLAEITVAAWKHKGRDRWLREQKENAPPQGA